MVSQAMLWPMSTATALTGPGFLSAMGAQSRKSNDRHALRDRAECYGRPVTKGSAVLGFVPGVVWLLRNERQLRRNPSERSLSRPAEIPGNQEKSRPML